MSFWEEKHKITMEGKWIGILLGTFAVLLVTVIIALVVWIG